MSFYSLQNTPIRELRAISGRFRKLRRDKKWSQAEMAKRSGVSLGSIKRFELTGQISFESLLKLAHATGTLDEFNVIFQKDEQLEKAKKLFTKP